MYYPGHREPEQQECEFLFLPTPQQFARLFNYCHSIAMSVRLEIKKANPHFNVWLLLSKHYKSFDLDLDLDSWLGLWNWTLDSDLDCDKNQFQLVNWSSQIIDLTWTIWPRMSIFMSFHILKNIDPMRKCPKKTVGNFD